MKKGPSEHFLCAYLDGNSYQITNVFQQLAKLAYIIIIWLRLRGF